ncbi:MAG: LysR family transcriptional regulator [Pseudomonadota bacterium]|jgi:molybdate transport system regulatory protein
MTRTASGATRRKTLPQLSIRIDLDSEGRIGPGKIRLLEQIDALGSISAAGRAMNMSYKRAWDLVEEVTSICGAVVQRHTGGRDGGGATLTPLGQSLVARYRRIEKAAAAAVRADLAGLQSDVGRQRRIKRA